MYSGMISSEKEAEALRHELSSLKGRKSDREDQLLEAMERLEEVEGMVASLKERRTELDGQQPGSGRRARRRGHRHRRRDRSDNREAHPTCRKVCPARCCPATPILLQRKQGLAVAELSGGVCMGCRLELTASEMEEVRGRRQAISGDLPAMRAGRGAPVEDRRSGTTAAKAFNRSPRCRRRVAATLRSWRRTHSIRRHNRERRPRTQTTNARTS